MNMHERSAMSIDEAVRRRRSVRGFLPDEVSEATLARGVRAGAMVRRRIATCSRGTPHVGVG